jgi:hypothetical protein
MNAMFLRRPTALALSTRAAIISGLCPIAAVLSVNVDPADVKDHRQRAWIDIEQI